MKLKEAWLALVRYCDGDTFGTTFGNHVFIGFGKTQAQAEKILKDALERKGYKQWEGYFSRLESTDVDVYRIYD